MAKKESYHGRIVNRAKGDTDCARCHTEHYGKDFRIIRWPTSRDDFDHRETGYVLKGRHASLKCEDCHNPKHISAARRRVIAVKDLTRTYEGLTTACAGCHEDRHAGQLGANCQQCHTEVRWKPLATFDHTGTRYPLNGKHAAVACEKCHKPLPDNPAVIRYKPLDFAECTGCHQDPHHDAFAPTRCEACHNVDGWKEVKLTSSAFDHSRTKFPLTGKHAPAPCEKCHKDANFKTPIAHAKCMDCHRDQHKGQFAHRADHGECAACHTDRGWKPANFTTQNHQSTLYPLNGKHSAVQCAKCHLPAGVETNYHPRFQACLDCHKDPHGGQFARAPFSNRCEECHTVEGFRPSTFTLLRHQSALFALKGAHAGVACQDCHKEEIDRRVRDRQYRFATLRCQECHQDPHRGEFPSALKTASHAGGDLCESCHTLRSWQDPKPFDHSTSGFLLAGAHRSLICVDCHRPVAPPQPGGLALKPTPRPVGEYRVVPFKGAPEACAGCHDDVHAGQFQRLGEPADCAACHNTAHWAATVFNHNRTSFMLNGAHVSVPCRDCHNKTQQTNGRTVVVYRGTPRECVVCHKK